MRSGEADNWTTVYITGKKGFGDAVLNKVGNHWVFGSAALDDGTLMFWLPNADQLRTFKTAVGARIMLKYRLTFFTDIEKQLLTVGDTNKPLSDGERIMISDMIAWEHARLKPVA